MVKIPKIVNNDSNSLYIGILLLSILSYSIALFRQYVFDGYYFFNANMMSDMVRCLVPVYYHIFDMISDGGWFWSWQMGIGTSIFSHADAFFDPFVYITFILGRNHIESMFIWSFIAKLLCEGAAFYYYCRYLFVDKKACLVAGVFYAFSGYSMIVGVNFALGTVMVYLPLILLGSEKYLRENKRAILIISLFLLCIQSYYFYFQMAIGLAVYVIYRMLALRIFSIKKLFAFLLFGMTAIFLCMFILLPQIELVLNSPRTSDKKDVIFSFSLFRWDFKTFFTALIRAISNDGLGNVYTSVYQGWSNVGPDYYQHSVFASSFFYYFLFFLVYEKHKKYIKFAFCLALCTAMPFFSYVFNSFSTINARWLFWISFIQCLAVAIALNQMILNKKFFYKALYIKSFLFGLCVFLLGGTVLALPDSFNSVFPAILKGLAWFAFLYCIGYGLHILVSKPYLARISVAKYAVPLFAFMIIGADILYNYYWWFESSYSVSEYTEENRLCYRDGSYNIIQKILPKQGEFYRINKSFDSVYDFNNIPSEQDALYQGYFGLKDYNSLGNSSYISFLSDLGCYCTIPSNIPLYIERGVKPKDLKGQELNYINGVEDRYNLMAYLGCRYYLSKNTDEKVPGFFTKVSEENNINVYENPYYMPLAFCNNRIIPYYDFVHYSDSDKELALLSSTVLDIPYGNTIHGGGNLS